MSSFGRKSSLQSPTKPECKPSAETKSRTSRSSKESEPSVQPSSRSRRAKSTAHSPSTPVSARAPSLKLPEELFRAGWTSLDDEWWPGIDSLEVTKNRWRSLDGGASQSECSTPRFMGAASSEAFKAEVATCKARQSSGTHASSTAKAALERRRSSLKKTVKGKSGSVGWSPMKTKALRRPPPLVLPDSSAGETGKPRTASDGERALQEWQRAMKSPSPEGWKVSSAVMQLKEDTIALAAGAVTAMLAANAAAAGPMDSPEKVVRRTWDWLAEQPEDAAELALLLFEAAPKLNFSETGPSRQASSKIPRRASYKEQGGFRQRLARAVPMPSGGKDVDWRQLRVVVGSEMLEFEATAYERQPESGDSARGGSHASPRGDLVEVNSGGQVLFCFFAPAGASAGHHHRVAQSVDLGNLQRNSQASHPQDRSCTTPKQGTESPQMVATYYNPAYRPALEEELSSTDVKHAALSSRLSDANDATSASPFGSPNVSAPRGRQADILRLDSEKPEPSLSPRKGRRISTSSAPDAKEVPLPDRPPAMLTPGQRFTLEEQLQQLSPFAAHHSPRKPAKDGSSPRKFSVLPCEDASPQAKAPGESHKPVGVISAPARSPMQPARPQGCTLSQAEGHGRESASMAAAAVAMAAAMSPHRPSSTHSSPCLSMRGCAGSMSEGTAKPPTPQQGAERVLIVKGHHARLASQSEQFANELTRHLGICAPECRILRKVGATQAEWKQAHGSALLLGQRGADLEEQMGSSACVLVMDYIPGRALLSEQEPFQAPHLLRTAEDLGRLFLLDMLLGNPDRMPCEALGWRGNPHNIMYCRGGTHAGRVVAIDSAVQRRPPGGRMGSEDAACNRLTELALNDISVAGSILAEAVSSSAFAVEAVTSPEAHEAFQKGLGACLNATMHIKGLLEMMFDKLAGWIDEFITDMENVEAASDGTATPPATRPGTPPSASPGHGPAPHPALHSLPGGPRWEPTSPRSSMSTTQKIRSIGREARVNQLISERLEHWKAAMRERGEELGAAVEEWQAKRSQAGGAPRLTTGFLDGTHPIVDAYELKVRLEHMLQRLRVLQDAANTARPTRLLPHLWLSGAVEAHSLHVLRHLGITHVLNATEDLLLPEPEASFKCLRIPISDMEEEDIGRYFDAAQAFIDGALADGGAVLVHCHEGKSRSVTLILAYFMKTKDWSLKQALDFVSAQRPQVSPNSGFMARLIRLEESLHGTKTVKYKRTKPEPRICPVCRENVGVSRQSLAVHVRTKHGLEHEHELMDCDSPKPVG